MSHKEILDVARILISTDHSRIIAHSISARINDHSYPIRVNEEISGETLFISDADDFSPKKHIVAGKPGSVGSEKGVAMDSISRVLCTLEEMNSARSEKEVVQSSGEHVSPMKIFSNLAKSIYKPCSFRQNKKATIEAPKKFREE
ncbi:hypothetical protein Ancab_018681 [Ancistrocladus abbreviatus]